MFSKLLAVAAFLLLLAVPVKGTGEEDCFQEDSSEQEVNQGDEYAGVTFEQFSKVFLNDTDKCGPKCKGYRKNPNTPEVVDRHWHLFKSAAKATNFKLANINEAAIFFGQIAWEYGGNLDYPIEFCARIDPSTCPDYRPYYGRGFLQLTTEGNYKGLSDVLGVDLIKNPDLLADPNRDLGWQATMTFWIGPIFNCAGSFVPGPTCAQSARANNIAGTTRRINPLECGTGPFNASQPGRIATVQRVRVEAFGLPRLTKNLAC